MTIDMYSERVADASALIREFAKKDYFNYFQGDTEQALEAFIAMLDQAEEKGRQEERAKAASMTAQAPVREVPGWLPIETAPKDGSEMLLWLPAPYNRMEKARWFDLWENWQLGDFPDDSDEYCGIGSALPTHYMPLPSAPVQQEGA